MGIRGLMNFIKRFETDLTKKIDMKDEMHNWKM